MKSPRVIKWDQINFNMLETKLYYTSKHTFNSF